MCECGRETAGFAGNHKQNKNTVNAHREISLGCFILPQTCGQKFSDGRLTVTFFNFLKMNFTFYTEIEMHSINYTEKYKSKICNVLIFH